MDKDKKVLFMTARLGEHTERYDDVVDCMKKIADMRTELSSDERNLISLGYKNLVGARRNAWRTVIALEEKETAQEQLDIIRDYKKKIEQEIQKFCDEFLDLIDKVLLPSTTTDEGQVFFYKLKGDYLRYEAEYQENDKKQEIAKLSEEAYSKATEIAQRSLKTTNPIRLGLALNFSVFYYEILTNQDKACDIAKRAFDDAVIDLDGLSDETYADASMILQLIKENLNLWNQDFQESDDDDFDDDDDDDN
ncbi:14-3-3 protein epsilon [Anaeramoeba ignava]|uniref:14-3-3 protein epsilon n=1 Tax=Anaeramoeba ignava TaxID=1746090 RepID=A0A9Q0LZZ9_ANAIG|nr:14-3-3 protein epsilon [Anaeramoeba ignava]|eukprot:Anaeramoba_ignava/a607590_1003.p1 GENE.a607590_1003~~a607590_1003.p1  ORF type:complete len:250 (+),score=90.46 a607590_1003:124-873(+)